MPTKQTSELHDAVEELVQEVNSLEKEDKAVKKANEKLEKQVKGYKCNTFSKTVMAGVMYTYFAGVALGVYAVITSVVELEVVLDYITKLALPVGMAYLIKAFGENIAKIVLGNKLWKGEQNGED